MDRKAKLSRGEIDVGVAGRPDGRVVLLPGAKRSVYGKEADALLQWGVDPLLGERFVQGLAESFRVVYFDYESYLFSNPYPEGLTAERAARDMLEIADAAEVGRFSYYGYSWLALVGLQVAIRTDRMESLVMGGFPPLDGPYAEMLEVTRRTHELARQNWLRPGASVPPPESPPSMEEHDWDSAPVTVDPQVALQFRTLYESLADFDDRRVQDKLGMPRLVFAGERDRIAYGERFGGVTVDIAGPIERHRRSMEQAGWRVELLRGADMDHVKAMQPDAALPLIKPWLEKALAPR